MKVDNCFGIMLDCSRNAVMSVCAVKDLIDKMSVMGYNCLMLYTEETYEIESQPLFGYLRGRYSKAELKEIVKYADSKNIETIPCIQTLAHLEKIFQYPEYQAYNDMDNILLVDDDRTYNLIEEMFKTCKECFTTDRIHIGMDEAHNLGLGNYLTKHGYENRFDIFVKHLDKVCAIAEKYGLKPLIWSDMFFRLLYDGDYYGTGKQMPESVKEKIPESVDIVYWDYYHEKESEYSNYIKQHKALNREIWFAGGAWKWHGFNSANVLSNNRTKNAIKACKKHGINNVVITLWGDNGNECPLYSILPSLLYASECFKGNYSVKNAKQKFKELFGESWSDFILLDMKNSNLEVNELERNDLKKMFFNDCFLGKCDYEAINSGWTREEFLKLSKKFKNAKKKSVNFAYLFDSYQKLSSFLAVKFDLGYRTRIAYQSGNKAELQLILKDYNLAIKSLKLFLESFRRMWYNDNKPHGFDVQEIRIGGTLQRLKSCSARLKDYLTGKMETILELEEKMVEFKGGPKSENIYSYAVTVNLF